MLKAELIQYLSNPGRLNKETLDDLLKITDAYPYFQTARLLAMKNKFILEPANMKADIDFVAAYVPARNVLYDLLYPLEEISQTPVNAVEQIENEDQPIAEAASEAENISPPVQEIVMPEKEEGPVNQTRTLKDNISNLLSLQLEELELLDPSEEELVPEVGLNIDQTYGTRESEEFFTLESDEDVSQDPAPVNQDELIEKFIES